MALARLLVALSWAGADGLQSASREGSAVHIDGLTADTWQDMFDHSSSWLDRIKVPPQAQSVRSIQEHMLLAQQGARSVAQQMGAPDMPHDYRQSLGDGSVEGIKAKAYQHFGALKGQMPSISGVVDYGLSQIGGQAQYVSPDQAFEQYSMVAERMGAKSLANQLAPLLRSATPPNPSTMFNLIGNILTTYRMPAESVNFYQELGRMYTGGREPTEYQVHRLQNFTMQAARNRTAPWTAPRVQTYSPPGASRRTGMPDFYRSTMHLFIIVYSLPCRAGSKVCFSLTNEFYMHSNGPGMFGGAMNYQVKKGSSFAAGIATQTPWSFISTPFYLYPSNAVGHEYDLKFSQGAYLLNYAPKTAISTILKLRESPTCVGMGKASSDNPRMDTCPLMGLVLTGGDPEVYSILEILPLRCVDKDSLVSFYDILKYGGPLKGPYTSSVMPDWAWAGFYRAI